MQRVMANVFSSKARPMVILRWLLAGLVVIMGLARMRLILMLLGSPATLEKRDILQEYLMAKALVSGMNPYLPLNQLAHRFIGNISFLPHPAPYPPFVAVLSTPLLIFNVNQLVLVWLIFEILCLAVLAGLITILWKGKLDWAWAAFILFVLLCWYPAMVDLLFGQLTIPLTTLLMAALLAWRKERKILTGVLTGISIAIKMYTWPLILYYAIKKDWRTVLSSAGTLLGLNFVALLVMGFGPFTGYYVTVASQVSQIYQARVRNYSLWSIGYRLFQGSGPSTGDLISVPPLADLPRLAPVVSAGLAAAFLLAGLYFAYRIKRKETGYAIVVCVLIAISPISWDHYYFMAIISLVVLLTGLAKRGFPNRLTLSFISVALLLLLFNEFSSEIMFSFNGGITAIQANGNQVSFASSLVEMLPMLELVLVSVLLWRLEAGKLQPAPPAARG